MAIHITASGAQSIGLARAIKIQVGLGITGTITVTTAGSTQYGTNSATQGIFTNPASGSTIQIGGLHGQGAVSINPSDTTDLSVTKVNNL